MMTEAGTVASEVSLLASVTVNGTSKAWDSCNVPVADPPFSLIDAVSSVRLNTAVSSSVTVMVVDPLPSGLVPVKLTVWSSSSITSSTPVMGKVAEFEPAKMVTEAGTVASLVSLLASVMMVSVVDVVVSVTVPVAVPPFSLKDPGLADRDTVVVSTSVTVNAAESLPTPTEDAETEIV